MLMGDLNLPENDYVNFMVSGDENSYPARFFDLMNDLFLCQHVGEFTRFREGQKASSLDLIFTSTANFINELKYLTP